MSHFDAFASVQAEHEGRVMRLRNLPEPMLPVSPPRRWWQLRQRRDDRFARRWSAAQQSGWWQVDSELMLDAIARTPFGQELKW